MPFLPEWSGCPLRTRYGSRDTNAKREAAAVTLRRNARLRKPDTEGAIVRNEAPHACDGFGRALWKNDGPAVTDDPASKPGCAASN